jgi:L-threonylcarbamoyladenylate synthase
MKYLKLNLNSPEQEVLLEIASYLKKGKVVVMPTDTIYGLSCLATSQKAIQKIALIKKKPLDKDHPFLVLVSSLVQAKKVATISERKNKIWKNFRETGRPVTVIFPSRCVLAKDLENKQGGLGLRLPVSNFLRKLIKLSNETPLVSTSFNLHQQEPFTDMTQAIRFFENQEFRPDLIVDGGPPLSSRSSQLLDLCGEKEIILRK